MSYNLGVTQGKLAFENRLHFKILQLPRKRVKLLGKKRQSIKLECSNITVVGDPRCRRSTVCVHSCSVSASDAYKSAKSELTNSWLSPFVPLWENHCVVVLGYRRRTFYNQHTFKASAVWNLEHIFPIGNSV